MAVARNVIANYAGYGIRAIAGIAFIPVYIRLLGPDAFGLIAIFAMMQVWLTIIDVGMKPALAREMARFTAGAVEIANLRNLLRSVEIVTLGVGLLTAIAVALASGWLAVNWVASTVIPDASVAQAFIIMGGVAALRFVETLYTSSLSGLQRQVVENLLSSGIALLRGLGAVAVLAWVSPTIQAYFIWQGLVSLGSILVLALTVYRVLPASGRPAKFSISAIILVWRFAAGSLAVTALSLLLTQADKVVLSKLLSLEAFGYYALAGVVANVLHTAAAPISAAFYPRLTELTAVGDRDGLRRVYHQSAQCVSVLVGSVALTLMAFAGPTLLIWTQDNRLASAVAPLTVILVLGMLLHCLMWMPYYLQLASGWVSLSVWSNLVAVVFYWPALLLLAPRFGAPAAAWLWVAVTGGFLLIVSVVMHRRLLEGELVRWMAQDVLIPLCTAAAVVLVSRVLMPGTMAWPLQVVWIGTTGLAALTCSGFCAPALRAEGYRVIRRLFDRRPGRFA